MESKWTSGDSALLLTVILFILMIYLMANNYMSQHWWIDDLQRRIGTLEQQCK